MKDYIYIYNSLGEKEKMELVLTFKLKDVKSNYVIYKSLDDKNTYIARYKDNIEDLDTNITEKEIELIEKMLEGIKNEISSK